MHSEMLIWHVGTARHRAAADVYERARHAGREYDNIKIVIKMQSSAESIAVIVSMGFAENAATWALSETNSVDEALELLL